MAAIAAVLIMLIALPVFSPAVSVSGERLPDLAMAALEDFNVEVRADGRRFLRFSATVLNVGEGPLEVRGSRIQPTAGSMQVTQIVENGDGATRHRTQATMTYAGDGHEHWHVHDVMRYDISTTDGDRRASEKTGFCFWDNRRHDLSLSGAPAETVYSAILCGDAGSITNRMGLSVGWGDRYRSTLAWQWVEITDLPDGRYVVSAEADPYRLFREVDTENNCTTAAVEVSGMTAILVETDSSCPSFDGDGRADRVPLPRVVRAGCLLSLFEPSSNLPCPMLR